MKRIFIALLMCSISFITVAQRANFTIVKEYDFKLPHLNLKSSESITDTLIPDSFIDGTPVLYSADNSGYVFGANGYNDLGKAQLYVVEGTITVEGMMIWLGANSVSEGDLSFKVWSIGEEAIEEETVVAIPFSELVVPEEGAWYSVNFQQPAVVTDGFLVGVEWSGLTEGFGIVSTQDGDAKGTDLAYEMMEDGLWYSVLSSWELDVDLGIFPVVGKVSESDAEILSFSFPEDYSMATINSDQATVNAVVNKGTDLTKLTPTIVVSPGAQVSVTTTDFSLPVDLEVEAADGTKKNWTISVVESTVDVTSNNMANVLMYPNPVNNTLFLDNLQNIERVEIVSISGQIMHTFINSGTSTTFNMQNLEAGIYIVRLYTNNRVSEFKKIIKQ